MKNEKYRTVRTIPKSNSQKGWFDLILVLNATFSNISAISCMRNLADSCDLLVFRLSVINIHNQNPELVYWSKMSGHVFVCLGCRWCPFLRDGPSGSNVKFWSPMNLHYHNDNWYQIATTFSFLVYFLFLFFSHCEWEERANIRKAIFSIAVYVHHLTPRPWNPGVSLILD
jgi:hypothetical protein